MSHITSRRQWLSSLTGLVASSLVLGARAGDVEEEVSALERRSGGRLGVCLLDTGSTRVAGYRLDERFAMCSTFKLPLAAAVLREADAGRLSLDEKLAFTKADILAHAPVTRERLNEGSMALRDLIEAAQITSDNTAANLVVKRLGGPAAFTALLRAAGDRTTRFDRLEPQMNYVARGEVRDTTTPRAMATTTARFLTGDLLSAASRELLIAWMVETKTGAARLRAGLPSSWRAGDKTGTMTGGGTVTDKYNDVAIAWPPGKPAILIAAYYDLADASDDMRDAPQAVLADVGRLAARWS